jgi:asparagine synthase (glutamine-hydrolysing)
VCGIAGILRIHPPGAPPPPGVAIPEAWLDIVDDSIKHRGPDGQGRFRDRAVRPDGSVVDVALVHRRLAIIDPACGQQPMVWSRSRGLWPHEEVNARARTLSNVAPAATTTESDDLVAVVFNGCIYNHRELRKELQAAGHRFETDHSDTEVLVHGWREWGRDLAPRLDGMFAIAIWDGSRAELHLLRDRAGEKPLFRGGWVFASTLPAVARTLRLRGRNLALTTSANSLGEWIKRGALGHSLLDGCEAPQGISYIAPVSPGGISSYEHQAPGTAGNSVPVHSFFHDRYIGFPTPNWTPRFSFAARGSRPGLRPEQVEDLLHESVRARLDADVPLACFLSGGVDSPLLAAIAQRELSLPGRKLTTLTVRMPDARYDESEVAARIAGHLGTEHVSLDAAVAPADDLLALIQQLGQPLGDSSLLPTHWVSCAARQRVRVALAGDGADELFGGYERYVANAWARRHEGLLRRIPLSDVPKGHPKGRLSKLMRLVSAAKWSGYNDLVAIFPEPLLRQLVDRGEFRPPDDPWPDDPLREDFVMYLGPDILQKTDTASMAVALEVRAPFLSNDVINAALGAPIDCLMPRGQRKGLLRQVARKYLPAEIVDRPKQGFAIPIGEWFRSDYGRMKTLLLDHLNSTEPWGPPSLGIDLNMRFVRQMLDEHLGNGPSGLVRRDHSQRLYMLLVLSIWAKWLGSL